MNPRFLLVWIAAVVAGVCATPAGASAQQNRVHDPDCYRGECRGVSVAYLPYFTPRVTKTFNAYQIEQGSELVDSMSVFSVGYHSPMVDAIEVVEWGFDIEYGRSEVEGARLSVFSVPLALLIKFPSDRFFQTYVELGTGMQWIAAKLDKVYSAGTFFVEPGFGLRIYTRLPFALDLGVRYIASAPLGGLAEQKEGGGEKLLFANGDAIPANGSGLMLRLGVEIYIF